MLCAAREDALCVEHSNFILPAVAHNDVGADVSQELNDVLSLALQCFAVEIVVAPSAFGQRTRSTYTV